MQKLLFLTSKKSVRLKGEKKNQPQVVNIEHNIVE